MQRRAFLQGALGSGAAMTLGTESSEATPARSRFKTRGVYFHDGFTVEPKRHAPLFWQFEDWKREIDWLHACGIDTIEFATMLEFNRVPSTELERRKVQDKVRLMDYAHRKGMRFGYLLTNTVVSSVPDGETPGDQLKNRAVTLCPREPGNFEKTIAIARYFIDAFREADHFEQFAADWGGCTCGQCGVPEFLRYVRTHAEILAERSPKALLYADTWSIAAWGKDPFAQGWKAFFDREISGSREVIAALPGLPKNVHLALPCHHLYRPLAYAEYGGKAKTPLFPAAEDIRNVRRAGRETLAWTHFVMDDDAYRPKAWGVVHSETRYIQGVVQSLLRAGIDRVMGNLYLPLLQLPNTYAFGRLLERPDAKPERILEDFARLVAHRDDVNRLTDALFWLENHSYWQEQTPPDGRLPNLPNALNRAQALEAARQTRPRPGVPELPLPISAADWLADLARSIERMDWTT